MVCLVELAKGKGAQARILQACALHKSVLGRGECVG